MRILSIAIISLTLCACLPTADEKQKSLSKEQMALVLDDALANPKAFQTSLKESCTTFSPLLLEVAETINMGSRIWNAGGLPITIRLYEGVAYRVLYEAGDECPDLSHAFQAGLWRAEERDTANGKGRVLRQTLDLIMGGLPAKPPGAQ
ncbi:MAG: hypothetical protein R8G33_06575 [Gammaproteobacteria bacterium]|nr:hypothetical protein [Gammaproteobacteria bacterium]